MNLKTAIAILALALSQVADASLDQDLKLIQATFDNAELELIDAAEYCETLGESNTPADLACANITKHIDSLNRMETTK